eukprot:10004460-Alexandrium_andersonii.AAC.1
MTGGRGQVDVRVAGPLREGFEELGVQAGAHPRGGLPQGGQRLRSEFRQLAILEARRGRALREGRRAVHEIPEACLESR